MPISTEQVWRTLRDELGAFLRRRVQDEHLADDLLQETFARVHRGLGGLADEERLVPWVYRVARNVLADHRRTARPSEPLESAQPEELAAGSDDRVNLNAEVDRWLRGMLALLPEDARQAVELAELDGLSLREIATRLGLSPSGAKSRVQRGRARLRQLLLECCHLEFDGRGNVVDYRRRADQGGCPSCE